MAKVFFSYSHVDEEFRDELDKHLSPLKRLGIIETWHDRAIIAGKELDHEIDSNLKNSNIILLLVSANFIDSNYCYEVEMKEALSMNRAKTASVVPIILHKCDWQITPLGKLNACPKDGKAITSHENKHEAYTDVAKSIKKVVEARIRSEQPTLQSKIEQLSSINENIRDESEILKEQIKQEKSLYKSRHRTLIDWLSQNNESLVSKIYLHIVEYHNHLELTYKIPLESSL